MERCASASHTTHGAVEDLGQDHPFAPGLLASTPFQQLRNLSAAFAPTVRQHLVPREVEQIFRRLQLLCGDQLLGQCLQNVAHMSREAERQVLHALAEEDVAACPVDCVAQGQTAC
jgi:hypothetical protein